MQEYFQKHFKSVRYARGISINHCTNLVYICMVYILPVIEDDDGVSKGYGFVRFMDEAERNRCYAELDRALGLGKKPITIRPAFAPKSRLVAWGQDISSGIQTKNKD